MLVLQMALAGTPEVVFIVNIENNTEKLTISEVRDLFLKKYINKTASDVELFWIGQKLYSGDSAPLKEASDLTTMSFVGSLKGAIGYVDQTTVLRKNVKVLKIEAESEGD